MSATLDEWVRCLELEPHPEGGWYREVYRASEVIPHAALPGRFGGDRAFSTSIYYLLGPGDFSALHRIEQDEVWHWYDGGRLLVEVIHPDGTRDTHRLGRDVAAGDRPMAVVPAGSWFGACVDGAGHFALAGCTVAPGFDFDDFHMPKRDYLIRKFPEHRELIERFTR